MQLCLIERIKRCILQSGILGGRKLQKAILKSLNLCTWNERFIKESAAAEGIEAPGRASQQSATSSKSGLQRYCLPVRTKELAQNLLQLLLDEL